MTQTYIPEAFTPPQLSAAPLAQVAPPDGSFIVEVSGFSGPLDLLLSLIREEQLDIYDIPIARICEQYVVRIRTSLPDARKSTTEDTEYHRGTPQR